MSKESLKAAYEAGRDAGFNGASVRNSHYGFFSDKDHMNEWERGRLKGIKEREQKDKSTTQQP